VRSSLMASSNCFISNRALPSLKWARAYLASTSMALRNSRMASSGFYLNSPETVGDDYGVTVCTIGRSPSIRCAFPLSRPLGLDFCAGELSGGDYSTSGLCRPASDVAASQVRANGTIRVRGNGCILRCCVWCRSAACVGGTRPRRPGRPMTLSGC
jgi:hypothetical protein